MRHRAIGACSTLDSLLSELMREEALRAALDPRYMHVTDVTDGHAVEGVADGRAISADGRDIRILIVAAAFEGMALLDRQRAVNEVLKDDLATGKLHSVRMKCWTPEQWQKQGAPEAFPAAASSQCAKPASAKPASSPASVILETPSTKAVLEAPALRLPEPVAKPAQKQESLFVCEGICEGGCGLAR